MASPCNSPGNLSQTRVFTMRRIMVLLLLVCSAIVVVAQNVAVNCDAGQSLNTAISKLNKQGPNTVLVHGTCTEYVTIEGFENLTVKSTGGATLVQPSAVPANLYSVAPMHIIASRSVTVDGLNFTSDASKPPAIFVEKGSTDVLLHNLNVVGGSVGIFVAQTSEVWIARVNVKNSGWAYVFAVDGSNVHLENCLLEESSGTGWHYGISSEGSPVYISRTTVRNMQVSLNANLGGSIGIEDFNWYSPFGGVSDVVIDNPAGQNYYGVTVDSSATAFISSGKLRILNAGQPWGGDTGGIKVSASSSLWASNNLIISGSQGQGIYVTGNSHAYLNGSSITGNQHGGLVAVNLSTIAVDTGAVSTPINGNAVDVFCDSKSLITGGSNINASTIQCPNLLPGDTVPIP
jgi:nitrous oxidase accessory protein NosD